MSKFKKTALGIATVFPLVLVVAYVVFFFVMFFSIAGNQDMAQDGPPTFFFVLMGFWVVGGLWVLVLMVIYIVNIFNNGRIDGEKKALWAVVIFMGNIIAMPVYWYIYIWREPKRELETVNETVNNT